MRVVQKVYVMSDYRMEESWFIIAIIIHSYFQASIKKDLSPFSTMLGNGIRQLIKGDTPDKIGLVPIVLPWSCHRKKGICPAI